MQFHHQKEAFMRDPQNSLVGACCELPAASFEGTCYLSVVNGATRVADSVGVAFQDIGQARDAAIFRARALMAADVMMGQITLGRQIEVCDDAGRVLLLVPFKQAVAVSGNPSDLAAFHNSFRLLVR
jgi:hypothetical protein